MLWDQTYYPQASGNGNQNSKVSGYRNPGCNTKDRDLKIIGAEFLRSWVAEQIKKGPAAHSASLWAMPASDPGQQIRTEDDGSASQAEAHTAYRAHE